MYWKNLEMDKGVFLDLCIMCGTDYNPNIPMIGSKKAYKYLKKHGSIDIIEEKEKIDTSILNHQTVRQLFQHNIPINIDFIPSCSKPDFDLTEFVQGLNINVIIDILYNSFIRDDSEFEIVE